MLEICFLHNHHQQKSQKQALENHTQASTILVTISTMASGLKSSGKDGEKMNYGGTVTLGASAAHSRALHSPFLLHLPYAKQPIPTLSCSLHQSLNQALCYPLPLQCKRRQWPQLWLNKENQPTTMACWSPLRPWGKHTHSHTTACSIPQHSPSLLNPLPLIFFHIVTTTKFYI